MLSRTVRVGIDASMRSTGLVIAVVNPEVTDCKHYDYVDAKGTNKKRVFKCSQIEAIKYYRIVSNEPKSAKSLSKTIQHVPYYREKDEFATYAEEDVYKIQSADKLASLILKLVRQFCDEHDCKDAIIDARIEGSVMATSFKNRQSRLNDLTAFNTIIKLMIIKSQDFDMLHIVPPTTLKKEATGSGKAKKDDMEYHFKFFNEDFDYTGKVDDVIDAWFLALCNFNIADAFVK